MDLFRGFCFKIWKYYGWILQNLVQDIAHVTVPPLDFSEVDLTLFSEVVFSSKRCSQNYWYMRLASTDHSMLVNSAHLEIVMSGKQRSRMDGSMRER